MTHPIEGHCTDKPEHLDYVYARSWLRIAIMRFALCVLLAIAGLLITADTIVQLLDSEAVDSLAMAAGARPQPPLSVTTSLIGFALLLGCGLMSFRSGAQIIAVLDPMAEGKCLDSRHVETPKKEKPEPKTEMDEVVDRVDQVIEEKKKPRDAGWVNSDELEAAAG